MYAVEAAISKFLSSEGHSQPSGRLLRRTPTPSGDGEDYLIAAVARSPMVAIRVQELPAQVSVGT